MTTPTKISERGRATLIHHEGEPLRAYRDAAGVWTIGAGLTAASGVVKPRAGMTITREEARRLLDLAITRNYAPRVARHLDTTRVPHRQAAFDGSVSFDYNTGRIHDCTWAQRFNAGNFSGARASLLTWVRAGGRVLRGLERRRRDEADMIFDGHYPLLPQQVQPSETPYAVWAIAVDDSTRDRVRELLVRLGYPVGSDVSRVQQIAVRQFQADRGLVVDGIIGRATLETMQREIDAQARSTAAATGASGGAVAGGSSQVIPPDSLPDGSALSTDLLLIGGCIALAGCALYGLWLAYHYRDLIAARIHHRAPRLAEFLRSF